jgi:hypothetical protein
MGHGSLLWLISAHYPEEENKNLFWEVRRGCALHLIFQNHLPELAPTFSLVVL